VTEPAPDPFVQWLADRDVSCPYCSYNLRGLGHTCPECGRHLEFTDFQEHRSKAHARRFFACRLAATISFALGVILAIKHLRSGPGLWNEAVPLGAACLAIAQSLAWLIFARRITRLPLPTQARLATVMWAVLVMAAMAAWG